MTTLDNFPMISQLTKTSGDGSSPNAQFDCVPSCLCAGAMYLNGIKEMNKEYNPDAFLDMAYPEGYQGGTAARAYVEALAKLGIKLYPLQGEAASLVILIHAHLSQNHPVVCTVPDVYVPASYHWTHVLCAFSEEPGYITMLDPYVGKPLKKSDAEWAALLLDKEIWVMERMHTAAEKPGAITMNATSTGIPGGWKDDGTTLVAPNGMRVMHGFREYVLAHNWQADDLPVTEEYGTKGLEASNPALGEGTQQIFRFTLLGWTQKTGVIREYMGVELLKTRQVLADYYQKYKALQSGQADPDKEAELQQELDKAKARLAAIGAQLAHTLEEIKSPV